jgi:hypothetical protein
MSFRKNVNNSTVHNKNKCNRITTLKRVMTFGFIEVGKQDRRIHGRTDGPILQREGEHKEHGNFQGSDTEICQQ